MKLWTFMLHHSSDFFDPNAKADRTARSSMGMLKSVYNDCYNQRGSYSMLVAIATMYDTETHEHVMEVIGEYYAPLKKQVELNKRAKAQKVEVVRKNPFKTQLENAINPAQFTVHINDWEPPPGDVEEMPMPVAEGEF
jgi:hypothetical protein